MHDWCDEPRGLSKTTGRFSYSIGKNIAIFFYCARLLMITRISFWRMVFAARAVLFSRMKSLFSRMLLLCALGALYFSIVIGDNFLAQWQQFVSYNIYYFWIFHFALRSNLQTMLRWNFLLFTFCYWRSASEWVHCMAIMPSLTCLR